MFLRSVFLTDADAVALREKGLAPQVTPLDGAKPF